MYKDGDHVWVHDYQLMQVPYELRKLHPNCRVAWFLHTPFPSSEIYRILPVRKQLLQVGASLSICLSVCLFSLRARLLQHVDRRVGGLPVSCMLLLLPRLLICLASS